METTLQTADVMKLLGLIAVAYSIIVFGWGMACGRLLGVWEHQSTQKKVIGYAKDLVAEVMSFQQKDVQICEGCSKIYDEQDKEPKP